MLAPGVFYPGCMFVRWILCIFYYPGQCCPEGSDGGGVVGGFVGGLHHGGRGFVGVFCMGVLSQGGLAKGVFVLGNVLSTGGFVAGGY